MTPADLEMLRVACGGADERREAGLEYVFLPQLALPGVGDGVVVDALLCLNERDGYATRLFLSAQIPGKGNNWTSHAILGRTWWACSWRDVSASLRPIEILMNHLDAFR